MRKLNTEDLFRAARAIKVSGLRDELRRWVLHVNDSQASQKEIGIDTILRMIEVFSDHKAETAIFEVFAGPFECTADDVRTMELTQLMDNIEALAEDEGLKDFFGRLVGLIVRS